MAIYRGPGGSGDANGDANSAAAVAVAASNSAQSSATLAADSATIAVSASNSATSSANSAIAAYDDFDDRYLGSKSSDPVLDNDGNTLLTGALYWNSVDNVLKVYNGSNWQSPASVVSSVGLTAPTGLTVSNSPITSSGNIALTYTAGYSIPTTTKQSNWDTAFSWGNHASAGYLTTVTPSNLSTGGPVWDVNSNLGIGVSPDGAAALQIKAGTTSVAPIRLTSGPLLTTPSAGAFGYLTNVGYFTPTNNSRAVLVTEHFVARTGTKTLVSGSSTSLNSLFGGGTGGLTNGALTVDANTSYYFECLLSVSSMSASSGNLGFSIVGAGTAAFTSAAFIAVGYDQTTLTTPSATSAGGVYVATSALTTNVVTATTGTSAAVLLKGIFRIGAGGTIIPSIELTTAAAAVIGADCWFKCYPVGTDTVISVGNWS